MGETLPQGKFILAFSPVPVSSKAYLSANTAVIDSYKDTIAPATSITPLGAALGGVLRLCYA